MTLLLLLTYLSHIFSTLYFYQKRKYGVYQLPFLIACVNLTFILLQILSIYGTPNTPNSYLTKTLFMIITCNAAVNIGFNLNTYLYIPTATSKIIFNRRVRPIIILFMVIGLSAYMLNRGLYRGGKSSGIYVIINFFISFLQYALILIFITYKNNRLSKQTFLLLASFIILIYLDKTLLSGRRNDAIRITIIVSYFIFYLSKNELFYKRYRWVIPFFFILGMIGNTQIIEYRSAAYKDTTLIENLANLDFSNATKSLFSNNKGEVNNAVLGINYCYNNGNYDFGAFDWNRIIHDFVPKVFVGTQGKESLMISTSYKSFESSLTRFGSTMTGYFDAFASFGFFGFIKFLFISCFMGILWQRQEESDISKLLYFAMLINTIHIVTHTTSYFSNALIFYIIFITPFIFLIRSKS